MASIINQWKGEDTVWSVAVSPDGSRIGAGCENDVVIVDAESAQTVLGPLQGHRDLIHSVAFSPDGRTLASGSGDRTIRLWDTETGKAAMEPLTRHTNRVEYVAYTSDGRLLLSGSLDRTIRLWDVRTGQPAGQPIDTDNWVWTIAASPDGTKVAAGGIGGTIHAYDTSTRSMLYECTGHTFHINSVAFSPDGQRLASGSGDCTARLWDGSTGHAMGSPLKGHTHCVNSVSFSPDGRYLASGSDDKTVRIWDVDTGASRYTPLSGHINQVSSIAFTPDGSRLVSGSADRSIKIWDTQHLGVIKPAKLPQLTQSATLRAQSDPAPGDTDDSKSEALMTKTTQLNIQITATTSAQDIVSYLGDHGCIDMTDALDLAKCSNYPISSGGFGDVYRGKLTTDNEVAIKTIRVYAGVDEQNHKALKRAAREIYTWSKCRHPNVQPLLGLVVFRGQLGMVATWEVNGNLAEHVRRHPKADRCMLSAQVADGLAYLHASGVVHGDLKAVNVLVSKDGLAQLADFGSAVLHEYTLRFSQTSKANLTVRWASPELFRGGKPSQQADTYALGMTILETVTGEVPWSGKNDLEVQFAVVFVQATPERPETHIPTRSEHGNALWSLLKSCWAHETDDRPSAEHVARTLRGITQDGLKTS